MPASTVHAVLVRCRLSRLTHIDRVTGEPVRRYEHPHPGVDDPRRRHQVRQHPRWWRLALRRPVHRADRNRQRHRRPHRQPRQELRATESGPRSCTPSSTTTPASPTPRSATTRKAATAVGVLRNAVAWFTDAASPSNGCCPTTARPTDPSPGATPARAGHHHEEDPPLPAPDQRQDRAFPPHPGRRLGLWPASTTPNKPAAKALPAWLHHYNHHRPHTAIGGLPPITRLTNVPGQHI